MRVLVLVLATRAWPYPILIRTIKRTWASVDADEISTVFYYGGKQLESRPRDLYLPVEDALPAGRKTIACFAHVLGSRDFDVVFRTNCSSYVDPPNLGEFARRHARAEHFYCGHIGMSGELPFASGSGYFLSKDLVRLVVDRQDEWDHTLPDDVALAELLRRHGVDPEPAPRVEYRSSRDVGNVDVSQFLFRCKTASPWRMGDVRVMIKVHQAFCRRRGRAYRSVVLVVSGLLARLYSAWLRMRQSRSRNT
jgi:hypothetical protein